MFCLTDLIKPIALPPRSLKNQNLVGKTARVSGWGKTADGKYHKDRVEVYHQKPMFQHSAILLLFLRIGPTLDSLQSPPLSLV